MQESLKLTYTSKFKIYIYPRSLPIANNFIVAHQSRLLIIDFLFENFKLYRL
jgi:hypothetical protein